MKENMIRMTNLMIESRKLFNEAHILKNRIECILNNPMKPSEFIESMHHMLRLEQIDKRMTELSEEMQKLADVTKQSFLN